MSLEVSSETICHFILNQERETGQIIRPWQTSSEQSPPVVIERKVSEADTMVFYLNHVEGRIRELLEILSANHINQQRLHIHISFTHGSLSRTTLITSLIRLAHVFDLTLLEMLVTEEDISSLTPINLDQFLRPIFKKPLIL